MNGSESSKLPAVAHIAVTIGGFLPIAYVSSKWLDAGLDVVFDVGIVAAVTALYGRGAVWWSNGRGRSHAACRGVWPCVSGEGGVS